MYDWTLQPATPVHTRCTRYVRQRNLPSGYVVTTRKACVLSYQLLVPPAFTLLLSGYGNSGVNVLQAREEDAMLQSFRRMRTQMLRAGLFKSSKSFYAWKVISLLGMYCTVAGILMNGQGTWVAALAGAFTLALAWQQSGWLAHDFLHHQVFQNRQLNNAFGYFIGNCLQGFSVDWWKSKHNTHHAVPNECTGDALPLDPGIHR